MTNRHQALPGPVKGSLWAAPLVLIILIPIVMNLFVGGPAVVVPPGHVGVKVFLGSVQDEVFDEGIHPTICRVIKVSTQSKSYTVEYDANNANAAVSFDLQTIGFRVNVAYYVNGKDAARDLVRFVDREPQTWARNLIDPAILQSVKVVFSGYTLREIVERREEARHAIAALISELVNERLTERDQALNQAILITQVTLDNIDYSDEFERVIEMTQQEEQRVRFAENELNRVRIEAMQQVVQAEAERQAAVERARGEALALLLRNEAQVQVYLALGAAGLDVNAYRFTEIWNGELPRLLGDAEGLGLILSPDESGDFDVDRASIVLNNLRAARHELEEQAAEGVTLTVPTLGISRSPEVAGP